MLCKTLQTDENNGDGDSGSGAAIVGMKQKKLCEQSHYSWNAQSVSNMLYCGKSDKLVGWRVGEASK